MRVSIFGLVLTGRVCGQGLRFNWVERPLAAGCQFPQTESFREDASGGLRADVMVLGEKEDHGARQEHDQGDREREPEPDKLFRVDHT